MSSRFVVARQTKTQPRTPPSSPPSTPTRRSYSSPAKFKEHYSHLTYASRRTNEDEEGNPISPTSKNGTNSNNKNKTKNKQSTSSTSAVAENKRLKINPDDPALKLPPLKLISGFAVSEDGYLMSRFVSPPRFGLNNLEEAAQHISGTVGLEDAATSSSPSNTNNQSSSPSRFGTLLQQQQSPFRNGNNNNNKNSSVPVFMATVSRDMNGSAKINIVDQKTAQKIQQQQQRPGTNHQKKTTKEQEQDEEQEKDLTEEEIEQKRATKLLDEHNNDPWLVVLQTLETQQTGLTERELGALEWDSVKKVIQELNLNFIADNPLHRAKAELQWRKVHDRLLTERIEREQQKQADREREGQELSAQYSAAKQRSMFALSDAKLRNLEFSSLVEQLYPPSPILQAAGGPVILVRTAPQGEILLNQSSVDDHQSSLENAKFVHYRKIPEARNKDQFGSRSNPQSSPLRKPALVKQIPK